MLKVSSSTYFLFSAVPLTPVVETATHDTTTTFAIRGMDPGSVMLLFGFLLAVALGPLFDPKRCHDYKNKLIKQQKQPLSH